MDSMTQQYLVTALWSSHDNLDPETGGSPLDDWFTVDDFTAESIAQAETDCAAFLERAGDLITVDDELSTVGHDFWLTRNHHGAGFWDGDYGDRGDALTEIAQSFGEVDAMVTVDPVDGEWPDDAQVAFS